MRVPPSACLVGHPREPPPGRAPTDRRSRPLRTVRPLERRPLSRLRTNLEGRTSWVGPGLRRIAGGALALPPKRPQGWKLCRSERSWTVARSASNRYWRTTPRAPRCRPGPPVSGRKPYSSMRTGFSDSSTSTGTLATLARQYAPPSCPSWKALAPWPVTMWLSTNRKSCSWSSLPAKTTQKSEPPGQAVIRSGRSSARAPSTTVRMR